MDRFYRLYRSRIAATTAAPEGLASGGGAAGVVVDDAEGRRRLSFEVSGDIVYRRESFERPRSDDCARVLLLGCGKMGGALLRGWLKAGVDATRITVVDPAKLDLPGMPGLTHLNSASDIPRSAYFDVVVIATLPSVVAAVLPELQFLCANNPSICFLSLVTGKTFAFFSSCLQPVVKQQEGTPSKEHPISVIRCMPQIPCSIGLGVSGLCKNEHASSHHVSIASELLSAVGQVVWVATEGQLEVVTGLAGCGPAYVFHFIDSLVQAGIHLGLPPHAAQQLAQHTVYASAAFSLATAQPADELINQVANPGGPTSYGVEVLKQQQLSTTILSAVTAATNRSIALRDTDH